MSCSYVLLLSNILASLFVMVLDFPALPWKTVIELAVYSMKIFLSSSSDLCIRFVHLHGSMADKF